LCGLEKNSRPPKYRNMAGYNDKVRNSVINFCAHTFMDMAPRYIYPKANIQQASIDHNYLRKPFTEYWIDTVQAVSSFQDHTITFVCKEVLDPLECFLNVSSQMVRFQL
jgi:hypothetical protein